MPRNGVGLKCQRQGVRHHPRPYQPKCAGPYTPKYGHGPKPQNPGRDDPRPTVDRIVDVRVRLALSVRRHVRVGITVRHPDPAVLLGVDPLPGRPSLRVGRSRLRRWGWRPRWWCRWRFSRSSWRRRRVGRRLCLGARGRRVVLGRTCWAGDRAQHHDEHDLEALHDSSPFPPVCEHRRTRLVTSRSGGLGESHGCSAGAALRPAARGGGWTGACQPRRHSLEGSEPRIANRSPVIWLVTVCRCRPRAADFGERCRFYEYRCTPCDKVFEELIIRRSDEAAVRCPSCKSDHLARVMSQPAQSKTGGAASRSCGPVG